MAWPATPKASGSSIPSAPIVDGKPKTVAGDSSPASTYGETAIDDSVPATPNDFAGRPGEGGVSIIDPVIDGNPIERLWAKEAPFVKPSVQDVVELLGRSLTSSSGSSEGAWEHASSIKRVASSEDLNSRGASMAQFDEDLGYDSEGNSRTEFRKKYRAGFVKGQDASNDPFICGGKLPRKETSGGDLPRSSTERALTTGDVATPDPKTFRPRGDRATQIISSDNAQAMLPPSSCVFIANLPNSLQDTDLQHAVENVFAQFGTVYVKIKRDGNGMPFAFAQYEYVANAERAIEEGRGLLIHGRACRTEQAKVNRSLYLSASSGRPISEPEARDILHGYGDLEKVWHCTDTERQMYKLPTGIWVTFAFFQDARDAQNKFKENPKYHLESYAETGWLVRGTPAVRGHSSPMSATGGSRALKVIGLPGTACPEHVRGLFDRFGKGCVAQIEMSSRIVQATAADTTAVVTFHYQATVDKALSHTYTLGGHKLTLKVVTSRLVDSQRRQQATGYSGSPSYRRRGTRLYSLPSWLAHETEVGYHPTALGQAMLDQRSGNMPFMGAFNNMSSFYPGNGGYQTSPYPPFSPHDLNGSGPSTYPATSSMNAVAPFGAVWQYPYYPAYQPASYPAPPPQTTSTSAPSTETQ